MPRSAPTSTRDTYADVIGELGRPLRLHHSVEITDGGRTKKPKPRRACANPAAESASPPPVLAAGPITCGVCGTDFAPAQPDQDTDDAAGLGGGVRGMTRFMTRSGVVWVHHRQPSHPRVHGTAR